MLPQQLHPPASLAAAAAFLHPTPLSLCCGDAFTVHTTVRIVRIVVAPCPYMQVAVQASRGCVGCCCLTREQRRYSKWGEDSSAARTGWIREDAGARAASQRVASTSLQRCAPDAMPARLLGFCAGCRQEASDRLVLLTIYLFDRPICQHLLTGPNPVTPCTV